MRTIEMTEVQPGEFTPATRSERTIIAAKREWSFWYSRADTFVLLLGVIPFVVLMFGVPELRTSFVEEIGRFIGRLFS